MSLKDYAKDVNRTVEDILNYCRGLGIEVVDGDDMLSDEAITELDNTLYLEQEEEVIEESKEDVVDNIAKSARPKKVVSKPKKDNLAKEKKEIYKNREKLSAHNTKVDDNVILYKENMNVKDVADALNATPAEVIKKLFNLGIMANINNSLNFETTEIIVLDYDKELKREETMDISNFEEFEISDNEENLLPRPAIVTIMGHVDHGKTTLLDTVRKANIADGEAGGITQTVSAYQVKSNNQVITFIDTPGHEAFTQMRARGASITDIVIIIVAADDGMMPQTREAIDHALAAEVPIIVAINKMDKPSANPDRVMTELAEYGLTPDIWGGETLYSKVSALTGDGIDDLLENILLIAEMNEYKANPNRYSSGTVIESRLDKHVGTVVTLLVQNGTLRIGDPIVVGCCFGKVRTLKNELGEELTEASPSQPVFVTGLNELPVAGDKFMAFETEKQARSIAEERKIMAQNKNNEPKVAATLEDIFSKIQDGVKEINILVKADLNGSAEAVKSTLERIEVEGVRVRVVRSSVGAITESDILLAQASDAIIVGFNVRPNNDIRNYAKENGVDIRLYDVIYKAVEEVEAAMKGMLEPIYEELITGTAEVRQLFRFSKVGTIAGSYITDGVIKSKSKTRIIRDGIVIYDGEVQTIQREKDTVREVKKGFECGITIEGYNDLKEGDIIEAYEMVEKKR